MPRFFLLTMIAVILLALSSCKASLWKPAEGDETPPAGATRPVLIQQAVTASGRSDLAETNAAGGVVFDFDEKNGRPRSTLVLRLDYFPDPKPGVANLPACYAPFPNEFELGQIQCADQAQLMQPLYVRNIDQDCYTDPNDQRVAATQPILMPGCRQGRVLMHRFDPLLRVDVEVREIN